MRSTLVSLVFILSASTIAAFEHNYTQNNSSVACKCGGFFDATQALLNDTLYQQVLDCTHQQDVHDWNYSTEVIFDATEYTACARVSYTAVVDSPTVLSMSTRVPVSVQKHVCLDGPILIEDITVTAPLMQSVNSTTTYHFQDTGVEISSAVYAVVPWYVNSLFDDFSVYINSAHIERMDAVVQSLCSHLTTVKGLSAPQHMYLGESNLNFLPGILW